MHRKTVSFILILLAMAGCKSIRQGLLEKQTPREAYQSKLIDAGLIDSKLGRRWLQAGKEALLHPVKIAIPYTEVVVFDYIRLTAASFQLFLREGQELQVEVTPEHNDTSRLFIDLFRRTNGEYKQEGWAEKDSLRLSHRVQRDGEYLLRIQPELLVRGLFTIAVFTEASLNFPVPEKDVNSISSFYGDPREGGGRKHEGVDVFAPRGTPALAVSKGRITRTGTNRLGGKVVWVTDSQRGYRYYYAHLDSQLVHPGMRVHTGDTLGFIGNTGNAVTTPPHLHFGIYAYGRRSIDPYAFFYRTERLFVDSVYVSQLAEKWGRTIAQQTNFREGPGREADVGATLPAGMPLKITGIAGNWVRVELPEGRRGFVYRSLIKRVTGPLGEINAAGKIVRSRPDTASPATKIIGKNEKVEVLAVYSSFRLIRTVDGYGWVDAGSS